MENNWKTLVIGAVENPDRYSFKATMSLLRHEISVIPLGIRKGSIGGVSIETEKLPFEGIHTVTLYINPALQENYKDYIYSLHPTRVIFNPGTENPAYEAELKAKGIEALEACTLVLLSIDEYKTIDLNL